MIVNSEPVNSTVANGAECKYIYVKPGMYDNLMKISNIDFVREIYAINGINLKKHISHLDNKEEEVLYITAADILKLSDAQGRFLYETAPSFSHHHNRNSLAIQIVNNIYHRREQQIDKTRK
ncbi:MAG: hypothetical protein ACLRFI_03535 [Alphaproteobacteria bacterium]